MAPPQGPQFTRAIAATEEHPSRAKAKAQKGGAKAAVLRHSWYLVKPLGLQPSPQKVVRPPWHPPQPSSQEVVGALGNNQHGLLLAYTPGTPWDCHIYAASTTPGLIGIYGSPMGRVWVLSTKCSGSMAQCMCFFWEPEVSCRRHQHQTWEP